MKVIEAQAALLTNVEVFQHLTEQKQRYQEAKHRGPPNLETVVKEVLHYLETHPSPMSQKPAAYTANDIARFLEQMRPYNLSKGEVFTMLNIRPASIPALNSIVEDMSVRFTDEQQEEMVTAIASVLGQFEPTAAQAEANGGGADISMDDATAS